MITEFGTKIGFPEECFPYLEESFEKIMKDISKVKLLYKAMDLFFSESKDDKFCYILPENRNILDEISISSGVNSFTVDFIFLIMCAKPLFYTYKACGISEDIYWDTVKDLTYKLYECKETDDVWGTVCIGWFRDHFRVKRFSLGRLQYEILNFEYDDYKGIVKKGDKVFNCHIPSSGPLTEGAIMDSLKTAYKFYKDEIKDGIMPVTCTSWLLYPPHYSMFPEGGNLRKFYDIFEVTDSFSHDKYLDAWRIFGMHANDDNLETLPEKTTLQKNFKKYFLDGKIMGEGFGIFLFDGEKILKN